MAKEKFVTMHFEIGNMFRDGMILRNLRTVSDIKKYYAQFEEKLSDDVKKALKDKYVSRLQKKSIDDGNIDLVIETKDHGIVGVISIITLENTCVGNAVTSIPNDKYTKMYADKAISMFIAYCKETYLYDDLILDQKAPENNEYIKKHNCYANISIVTNKTA